MTESQRKYQEEYEKWKHVNISPGVYKQKSSSGSFQILYEVLEVKGDIVHLKNPTNGFQKTKTLHWARKNLELLQE